MFYLVFTFSLCHLSLCYAAFGLGPVRYMTTSGQGGGRLRYSPISVHELHAESACTTSVQEGGPFRYSFWAISVHNEK